MNVTSTFNSPAMVAYQAAAQAKAKTSATEQSAKDAKNDDAVSLSKKSTDYSGSIGNNMPYFPVRAGMNADALVLGVTQPGAVSSSKDKSFAEVAVDARKRMDDKYAQMKAGEKPYSGSVEDKNALMGDLDRRSLNAVATNEGGKFSSEEQEAAKALMQQQARLASGHYSGPEDQKKNWKDPFANDPIGRAKAALNFLDNMSPEEKTKPEWLSQHQTLQDALAQYDKGDVAAGGKKKDGHFNNLAEILAGVDTSGSGSKDPEGNKITNAASAMMDKLKAMLPATK
ncbi:hypothetical protein [Pseudomonas sp. B21-053]|uniref:hypothetical protein n=1 Tax=Pseudomonas sp. B21-053 TaxID=2895493 RepID=UPI002231295E|nr:hypothetical protein [Pseudomonas sp. B21-053]UZE13456.1 hypothetical protein LOY68_07565 [Pseudomonas sp. B21-053]